MGPYVLGLPGVPRIDGGLVRYNNITDKFEMEKYEKNIIENLSSSISNMIISSVSEVN